MRKEKMDLDVCNFGKICSPDEDWCIQGLIWMNMALRILWASSITFSAATADQISLRLSPISPVFLLHPQ